MKIATTAALLVAALLIPVRAGMAQPAVTTDPHAGHATDAAAQATAAGQSGAANLPPAEEGAKARLNASPRHGEYADIALDGGTKVRAWVSYPERKDKAPVVIVIHEIFGLSDWIRSVADQLAADGFIAIAPDLLTGKGPNGGGTEAYASRDDVVAGVRGLTPDEVVTKLDAVRELRHEVARGQRQDRDGRILLGRVDELRVCDQTGGTRLRPSCTTAARPATCRHSRRSRRRSSASMARTTRG